MTGTRFKPITAGDMDAAQQRVAQALTQGPRGGVRGPFPTLLRIPELADRVRVLGDFVRFEGSLPGSLRELAVLVVARFWSAQYEWHAHARHAAKAGIDPSVPEAIAKGQRPAKLSPDEALVYDVCTELLHDRDVSDATYAAAIARFGENTLIELVCLVGYYGFVSLILNVNRTPIPEGAAPLPPLPAR